MLNDSIERFDYDETIIGNIGPRVDGEYVRYSDHERIVKELEAKFAIVYEQLVGRAKLIAYDTKNDINLYAVYTDDLEDVFLTERITNGTN